MKKLTKTLALFSLLASLTFAAEKTDAMLFGEIKSVKSGEHIPFADILVKGTNLGTAADATGHFKLAHLPLGTFTIEARAMGYKSQSKEVTFEKDKAVTLFYELEDDILDLERVVVLSTRTKHFVKDTPVRTEVISIREIENKNASNLFEALENIPGIRVEQQCQYCNFSMVRMQGLGAEHTQVLINGQPSYSGLAGVYGLQQIGTADVDRIEIVKGAGSALYGSSAVAGAINIVTRDPSYIPTSKIGVQFGSYNTNVFVISSSMRSESGKVGLNIFAQQVTGDAIDETGEGTTLETVKKPDGISDRVASNLANAGFNLFLFNPFTSGDKLVFRGKMINEKREGGTVNDDYYRNPLTDGTENIRTDRYETGLDYSRPIGSDAELNISLAYTRHKRVATNDSYLGDYMATHNDSVPDLREMRPYLASENAITGTATFMKPLGKHNLLVGTQVYFNNLNESGMYVVVDEESAWLGSSYRSTSDKSAREFGFFVQDEFIFNPMLSIVPGIRFDQHQSREEYFANKKVFNTNFPATDFSESSVNPRLALKLSPTDKIALRVNIGTGFRAPYGFSEDLHLCSGSPRVWKSSELNPERSLSANFSADYYGVKSTFSVNVFHTELKDKIGFTDADKSVAALGYDYQWKNIDDAFVQGIELSANTFLTTDLELGADFTFNQGEYRHIREDWEGSAYEADSKYISRFPMSTGNIQADYSPGSWLFSLSGNLQGSMYIDYVNEDIDDTAGDLTKIKKTDPFILINGKISKEFGPLQLYAGVDNMLDLIQDEKHLDDAAFMYAPVFGRMFYSGLSYEIK